eukprot:2233232-Pyramimonas_sp.AAC.1
MAAEPETWGGRGKPEVATPPRPPDSKFACAGKTSVEVQLIQFAANVVHWKGGIARCVDI